MSNKDFWTAFPTILVVLITECLTSFMTEENFILFETAAINKQATVRFKFYRKTWNRNNQNVMNFKSYGVHWSKQSLLLIMLSITMNFSKYLNTRNRLTSYIYNYKVFVIVAEFFSFILLRVTKTKTKTKSKLKYSFITYSWMRWREREQQI